MKTPTEVGPIAEYLITTYCTSVEAETPDDVRKACELLISKAARAIEKYNDQDVALEVLGRTSRYVATNPMEPDPADTLYREAVDAVVKCQRASPAFLQRRLGIGYNRAARMIEAMERDCIVSAMDRNGARTVLMLEVSHAN
ncbi:DNA translocase FtsK [Stutzerimonas stutzeri]|uniref:DNA translocase FtsK n=1 Tax=Stutzerimonas stutzeri TaxID=316 RepID=UPI003C6F3A1F